MTLQDRIETAMRDSMRARDVRRTQTLRMAMSAAHNREIELGKALTDEDYLDILGKQVKQRRESVEAFRAGGRESMAANEEAEAAILAEFLPEPLSAKDLESLVRAAIAESGASSPADLGRVWARWCPRPRVAPMARLSPNSCGSC